MKQTVHLKAATQLVYQMSLEYVPHSIYVIEMLTAEVVQVRSDNITGYIYWNYNIESSVMSSITFSNIYINFINLDIKISNQYNINIYRKKDEFQWTSFKWSRKCIQKSPTRSQREQLLFHFWINRIPALKFRFIKSIARKSNGSLMNDPTSELNRKFHISQNLKRTQ